jgi:hypothetical protein
MSLEAKELAALMERLGWQPIETAPKEKYLHILAYPVTSQTAGVVSWEPPASTPPMMRLVSSERHDHNGYWRPMLSMNPSPYEPTHWKPLDKPTDPSPLPALPALLARIEELEGALREIEKGEGPFSRDQLTHATNTIEAMKELASAALSPPMEG